MASMPYIFPPVEKQVEVVENIFKIGEITDPHNSIGVLMYLLITDNKVGLEHLVNSLIQYNSSLEHIQHITGNVREQLNSVGIDSM
jgi:hypothetical protein